jgi:hypothetical protein
VAVLVGFSVGSQFQTANVFRRDWTTQRTLFWQMAWRIPALKPGTTLVANTMPLKYNSDNSLAAPLNWVYAPGSASEKMPYMFYYVSARMGMGLKNLEKDTPIRQNYLAAYFEGNTSQVVALYYNPPACLRVLDPQLDAINPMVPEDIRQAVSLSNAAQILPGPQHTPPAAIFDPEPEHAWCYYFEKADLARQQGDWQTVVDLGSQAFNVSDHPNDPSERLPFIEGYAHTGDWERATALSQETQRITPLMKPILCQLWQRIAAATTNSPQKMAALQSATAELECAP